MLLRRLHLLLLALMLFAAGAPASAKNYTFNGSAISGCPLSGSTYTCASLAMLDWNDSMTIVSGYTVNITSDATFGYSQSLAMSGSAILASTGNLDIGGIATNNLNISGGTLIANGTFSVGAQVQTLTANIKAGTANLGTGSTLNITGNVAVIGDVNIASNTTITGAISGATVTTNSPVTLTGNVTASNSFTLASGSTVKGNVTAPVVSLLAASSTVTGNVTAKTSLQLGSSVGVTGDVATGTLTLDASNAIINGNATVDSAVLNWAGRVTKTIYCTGGTTAGQCDCVTNNSGYPVNTASGPHCQGKTVPLHHFQIGYDPTGSVCAPSTVTVTACADAACTSTYGGGATVTVGAAGQTGTPVAIGTSGVAQANVNFAQAGTATLQASGAATAGTNTCRLNGAASAGANCQVSVAASAYTMRVGSANMPANAGFPAESAQTLTVSAVRYDDASKACVPTFKNVTRNATFSCAYANPASGTLPVRLADSAGREIPLNATQSATAACGTGQSLALGFDTGGQATVPLKYADAGQVKITLVDSGANSPGQASVSPTFAPAAFTVATNAIPAPYAAANATQVPYIAGLAFGATVKALNAANATTPNFGNESPQQTVRLSPTPCRPTQGVQLGGSPSATVTKGVVAISGLSYPETGTIDLTAALTGNSYLGTNQAPTGSTNTATSPGCTGAVGPFIPAYFTLGVDADWTRKATVSGGTQLLQYYSGETTPTAQKTVIKLKITAYNYVNGVTANYAGTDASPITLSAFDAVTGAALAGTFDRPARPTTDTACGTAQVCPTEFSGGFANWAGNYTFAAKPGAQPTAQTQVRVRATADDGATSANLPATASKEPVLMIRSGRVRLTNGFGGIGKLDLPVSIEYYTGQTWVRNTEDSTTAFSANAVSVGTNAAVGAVTATLSKPFANGTATLSLTPAAGARRGSVPYAVNLGPTTANTSCYYNKTAPNMSGSTGANLAFLRSPDASCTGNGAVDPSALATFGVYAPETKRIIHVREVFR
jgi:MSHA biogenesis protein MshQ